MQNLQWCACTGLCSSVGIARQTNFYWSRFVNLNFHCPRTPCASLLLSAKITSWHCMRAKLLHLQMSYCAHAETWMLWSEHEQLPIMKNKHLNSIHRSCCWRKIKNGIQNFSAKRGKLTLSCIRVWTLLNVSCIADCNPSNKYRFSQYKCNAAYNGEYVWREIVAKKTMHDNFGLRHIPMLLINIEKKKNRQTPKRDAEKEFFSSSISIKRSRPLCICISYSKIAHQLPM